jgi:hypothetical protein
MKAASITRFLHSSPMFIIMSLLVVLTAVVAYRSAQFEIIDEDRGFVFSSPNLWISDSTTAMAVNVAATLAIGLLMVWINRVFNLLRTTSLLDASLFLTMSISTPVLLTQMVGTPLCIVLLCCMILLFSTYGNPHETRNIFAVFFILSAMTTTQYCYAFYIPVFMLGCLQMRVLTGRTIVAGLLGLITPWWIALGSGIVHPSQIHLPEFESIFGDFAFNSQLPLFASAGVTALLFIVGWVLNFPQMIAYNARLRAINGTMSILSVVTLIALCADFTNVSAYVPTLCLLSSFQLGKLFTWRNKAKSYIAIAIIFLVYLMLYVWSVIS